MGNPNPYRGPWRIDSSTTTIIPMNWLLLLWLFVRGFLIHRATLMAENLALRQQLAILHQQKTRPKLHWRDRLFWVWLSRLWAGWWSVLILVQPATVLHWNRLGFRLYWRWKSRGQPGRPTIAREVIGLIRRMARENTDWCAPRVRAELQLLGHDVAELTVAKYLLKGRKSASPSWKTFLRNHQGGLASIDFFVVPTVTFRLLYGFVVLLHEWRRVVHFK